MEKPRKALQELHETDEKAIQAEDEILSEMAKEEESEYNQLDELTDDITHDLRISKTRRG